MSGHAVVMVPDEMAARAAKKNEIAKLKERNVSLGDILDGKLEAGSYVDTFGCVTSVRLPIKTGGQDYKMSVNLTDLSLDTRGETLCFNIFQPSEEDMPAFQLSDVVLIKTVLVQRPRDGMGHSLLLRPRTRVHIFRPQPSAPLTVKHVPWAARPKYERQTSIDTASLPSEVEFAYALYLHKKINKGALPDITTFEQTSAQSLQIANKQRELKDVVRNTFCDLLVQVVSEPTFTDHPSAKMWVSDYSENWCFPYKGGFVPKQDHHNVGDSNGYLTKYGSKASGADDANGNATKWQGPQGRKSMFVTCLTPHVHFIKDEVKLGSWITMKNVSIRDSLNGATIEGLMHDDVYMGSPLRVALFEPWNMDRENVDPRFIAALQRKKALEKERKTEARKRKQLHDGVNPDKPLNARRRRQLDRQIRNAGAGKTAAILVNKAVSSEFGDQPVTALSRILDPSLYAMPRTGGDAAGPPLQLPFANIKFKAHVRVVDFLPKRLLDFAVPCRVDEYAFLGKDDDSSSSSSSEDEAVGAVGGGKMAWEWRFALLLEDASTPPADGTDGTDGTGSTDSTGDGATKTPPARVWAAVDNYNGQQLLKRDATDLRRDKTALAHLRETIFLLWGNLEELKLGIERQALAEKEAAGKALAEKEAERKRARKKEEAQQAAKNKTAQQRQRTAVNKEPMAGYPGPAPEDSDDDGTTGCPTPALAAQEQKEQQTPADAPKQTANSMTPKNIPFVCCLRQYGVLETVRASDDADSDGSDDEVGPKRVWRQAFGMFGTAIRAGREEASA